MADMQRSLVDAITNIPVQMGAMLRAFLANAQVSEPNTANPETTGEAESSLPASLMPQQVDSLLGTDGALFDHLSKCVKTPSTCTQPSK